MKKARLVAWLPLAAGAHPAYAHSPVAGLAGFYIGLLHPFSTPSQAILMCGLGLLAGGFATGTARWLLGGFLVASLVGLVVALRFTALDAMMFAAGFATCAVAALLPGRLLALAMPIILVGGFLIGEASIPDDGPLRDRLFTMSGSIVGANLGLLYLFGIVLFVRERYLRPWVLIAFRVVAAWLGAIALVMLSLEFAQIAPPS